MRCRYPHFPPANINLLAALAARNVEETVALGRQFGMQYPKEYSVGFVLKEHPSYDGRCEITIRVGNTRHTYKDTWDIHGSRLSAEVGAKRFMDNLQRQASTVVHMWVRDNPSFLPSPEIADKIVVDEQGLSHVAAFFDLPGEGRAGFFKLCTARDSYESMYLRVHLYKDRDCKKLMWDGCELQEGVATCLACLSRYVE